MGRKLLEPAGENSEGLSFVARPARFLYKPKWQLKIVAYRTFFSDFDGYMKNLGYSCSKDRIGEERYEMREPEIEKFKEDGPQEWYIFAGKEIFKYQKGNSLAVLESRVEVERHSDRGGYYSDDLEIEYIKMSEDAAGDVTSAIEAYLENMEKGCESEMGGVIKELHEIKELQEISSPKNS